MTQLQSTITCPQCSHQELETMPNGRLPVLLRLQRLRRALEAEGWRLLCVLLLRLGALSADPRKPKSVLCRSGRFLKLFGWRLRQVQASREEGVLPLPPRVEVQAKSTADSQHRAMLIMAEVNFS